MRARCCGEYALGNGPERVSVLLNPSAHAAYADRGGGPVELVVRRAFRPGRRAPARAAALAAGLAGRRLLARGLPAGLDVLHYPFTVPLPAALGASVLTLHDVQHHDLPNFFPRAERLLRRFSYDSAARRATLVVTPSEYARDRIVEVLGIAPERVVSIHHGIDHERFRPEPSAPDQLDGPERPFVLYPANVWPHKNHERLLKAFEQLRDPDLELVLTGRTYGRLPRLPDRVRHLGYVDVDSMPALYRAARALVFPSLYEGFGGPPLEAMACGCPVASSKRASLREVVGDACLELEPDSIESISDAIGRVVSDERLRSGLTAEGPRACCRASPGPVPPSGIPKPMSVPPQLSPPRGDDEVRTTMDPNASHLAVVPAYNEAETVAAVVRALREHAPAFDVLVIDDGSTDSTGEIARDRRARWWCATRSTSALAARCSRASSTPRRTATTTWSRSMATASTAAGDPHA